jgi:hypothetical protein
MRVSPRENQDLPISVYRPISLKKMDQYRLFVLAILGHRFSDIVKIAFVCFWYVFLFVDFATI